MSTGWIDPVAYEINREKAGALGRTGRKLENALAALARCEHDDGDKREALLRHATELLTSLVVQREACGLRDPRDLFECYAVPAEVVARIGVRLC